MTTSAPVRRTVEFTVARNPDGTDFVTDPDEQVRVTHDDQDGRDAILIDTPGGMLELDLPTADLLRRALRTALDVADPTRVNRLPARSAQVSNDVRVEQLAQAALNDYSPDQIKAQVQAAASGVWQAEPVQRRAWERALELSSEVA